MIPINCRKFHELISVETEGLLNNDELLLLNEHCKTCTACRKKRINASKSNICTIEKTPGIKGRRLLKIIIPVVILLIGISVFLLNYTVPEENSTPTSTTIDKKTENFDPLVNTAPKSTIQEENNEDIKQEQSTPVKVQTVIPEVTVEPEIPQVPLPLPSEEIEPEWPTATEKIDEPLPETKEDIEIETQIERENIDLITSEYSRTQVFDAIHSASPETETVSADSDFQIELSKEELSTIIEYLNVTETEFVISKSPESESVMVTFIFQGEKQPKEDVLDTEITETPKPTEEPEVINEETIPLDETNESEYNETNDYEITEKSPA